MCEIVRAFDHQGWKDSSRDDLTSCELHGPPRAFGAERRPLFAPCDAEGRQNISCLEYVQPCARLCTFTSQLLSPVMWSGWVELLSDPCAVVPQKLEREHAAVLVSVPVRSCGSTLSSHIKHVDGRRLQIESEWQHTDDHILCQSHYVTTFRANFLSGHPSGRAEGRANTKDEEHVPQPTTPPNSMHTTAFQSCGFAGLSRNLALEWRHRFLEGERTDAHEELDTSISLLDLHRCWHTCSPKWCLGKRYPSSCGAQIVRHVVFLSHRRHDPAHTR